jgi:hypothetical protein
MGRSQRVKGATFERDIAQRLGAKRNIGQARDGGDDITLGRFRIECKRRKRLGTVQAWLSQAEASCEHADDLPVVIARQDHGEPLVLMRFEDWLAVAGPALDAARSASHTARHATEVGRPRQLRPATAPRLQRTGGVRGGSATPSQPAQQVAGRASGRRQRTGTAPSHRSQRAHASGEAGETTPTGALLPSPEATLGSVRDKFSD